MFCYNSKRIILLAVVFLGTQVHSQSTSDQQPDQYAETTSLPTTPAAETIPTTTPRSVVTTTIIPPVASTTTSATATETVVPTDNIPVTTILTDNIAVTTVPVPREQSQIQTETVAPEETGSETTTIISRHVEISTDGSPILNVTVNPTVIEQSRNENAVDTSTQQVVTTTDAPMVTITEVAAFEHSKLENATILPNISETTAINPGQVESRATNTVAITTLPSVVTQSPQNERTMGNNEQITTEYVVPTTIQPRTGDNQTTGGYEEDVQTPVNIQQERTILPAEDTTSIQDTTVAPTITTVVPTITTVVPVITTTVPVINTVAVTVTSEPEIVNITHQITASTESETQPSHFARTEVGVVNDTVQIEMKEESTPHTLSHESTSAAVVVTEQSSVRSIMTSTERQGRLLPTGRFTTENDEDNNIIPSRNKTENSFETSTNYIPVSTSNIPRVTLSNPEIGSTFPFAGTPGGRIAEHDTKSEWEYSKNIHELQSSELCGVITIVLNSNMTAIEWILRYDDWLRTSIANVIFTANQTSSNSSFEMEMSSGSMVYVSPTPIAWDGKLFVSLFVRTSHKYIKELHVVLGETLVNHVKEFLTRLQLPGVQFDVKQSVPTWLLSWPCSSCNEIYDQKVMVAGVMFQNSEVFIVLCVTTVLGLALILCTFLVFFKYRRGLRAKYDAPLPIEDALFNNAQLRNSTSESTSVVFPFYDMGNHLASDQQCKLGEIEQINDSNSINKPLPSDDENSTKQEIIITDGTTAKKVLLEDTKL